MKVYSFLTTDYLLLFATDDTDGHRLFVAEFFLAVYEFKSRMNVTDFNVLYKTSFLDAYICFEE